MDPNTLLTGLTAGSLYALVAVGFNILYRPTNVFNFAQGDLVMLGALGAATVLGAALPWWMAAVVALVGVGVFALVEERVAVAPILRQSSTAHGWVITTLAVSLVIANLVGHIWGPDPRNVRPPPPFTTSTHEVLGVRFTSYQVALLVATIALVAGVERFYRTRAGKAVLAVAEDRDAALLRGIDPDRLSRWSFFLGGAFAGFTGLLAGPVLYASIGLGPLLLLKGFEAAAVGGVGDNRGALIAGYVLGVTESFGAVLLSPGYQQASTFVLLLAILLIRPQGLFGRPEARAV